MIAYDKISLDNRKVSDTADILLSRNLISREERAAIVTAYPSTLYQPNIFIRIVLLVAVIVIVSMSFGLMVLITGGFAFGKMFGIVCGLISVGVYFAAEYFVRDKYHFHSGVDDALFFSSVCFMLGAMYLVFPNVSDPMAAFFLFVLCLAGTLRLGNAIVAGVMFLSFFAFVYYGLIHLNGLARQILPFIVMLASLIAYFSSKKLVDVHSMRFYSRSLYVLQVLALAMVYVSMNYFIVSELTGDVHNRFFWITTVVIPVILVVSSVQSKDSLMLRIGILSIGATILSIRHYYFILPVDVMMTIAGAALLVITWLVRKYLHTSKHGISIHESDAVLISALGLLH